jgi:hypothetical protein
MKTTQLTGMAFSMAGGATLMYFADPNLGHGRRTRMRDRTLHLGRIAKRRANVAMIDLASRSKGTFFAAKRKLSHKEFVPNEVLAARVKTEIGRLVSNPHAIHVSAQEGKVALDGFIFTHELEKTISHICKVPGVVDLDNRLEAHTRAERHPALQGHRFKNGRTLDILQSNWSPATRLLVGLGGLAGGALLFRGAERIVGRKAA